MTPTLDRVFDVKVVSLLGLRLKGAMVYVFRDGTGVQGGRFDGTPLRFQFQNQGEFSVKALYNKLEKTQVVKPDEMHVTVRLGVRRSLTKAAVALSVIAVVAIWFLNAGIIPVGNPILSTRSGYTGAGPHVKPVAVVFVHGIFGGADSWVNQQSSFPDLLAADPDFAGNLDVFTFDYYSPHFGRASTITGLASKLRLELDSAHVFRDHQKVVFLVHSMGGLVVRQYVIQTHDLSKIPMIYFSASPTNGAPIAAIGRALFRNPQLQGMLTVESNDFLQAIQSDWRNWPEARSLPSYCAYEELPTYGVMVVPYESATALCNRDLDPVSANHIDIVKPASREDPRYKGFKTALENTSFGAQ
jgi:pimeloyl-ACP methyl ester carboxylesterase